MRKVFSFAAAAAAAAVLASTTPAPAAPGQRAPGAGDAIDEAAVAAEIDRLILARLEQEGLEPNADASDEVFVRRAHLDIVGRIPTKTETLAFLESDAPDKRSALVDALVGSDGYVSHTYNWFADLLRMRTSISGNNQSVGVGHAYEQWVKASIRESRPYDEMVRELITASGYGWENPKIGYYLRDYNMQLDNLAITTQVFLGTQIVCAQCHNHPFESWTQMDYYHLAAFTFGVSGSNVADVQQRALALAAQARRAAAEGRGGSAKGKGKAKGRGKGKGKAKGRSPTEAGAAAEGESMAASMADGARRADYLGKSETAALRRAASDILFPLRFNSIRATDRVLRLPHDYQYDDAKPRSPVEPRTLFGPDAVLSENDSPVEAFADWLTSPENPRFAKVIANRLWKRAFGVGLIEPVDDIKEHTTASNPELMAYLEELMLSLGFDLQTYQRILYKTRAYQREATLEEPVPGAPYDFAGPILRRMSAEQIWDSLVAMSVEDPDLPDAARILEGEKRLARVQLIAESVYDQTPRQFLRNLRTVMGIQKELSQRIEAAQARVAEAREGGDPNEIRRATTEAREIRSELQDRIEQLVYREGLRQKLDQWTGQPAAETASAQTGENGGRGGIGGEASGNISESANRLMDEAAAALFAGDRSFDEGVSEILGGESGSLVTELVDVMFAERDAELLAQREALRRQNRLDWGIRNNADRSAFRIFDRGVRSRMRRASELTQPAAAGHFLREFGQSDRELVENSSDEASVTQALALLNGPVLSAVTNRYSVLMRGMRGERFNERLDTIYLTMLSRLPTHDERTIFREAWEADPESGTIPGIVWTLLNTRQFLFIA